MKYILACIFFHSKIFSALSESKPKRHKTLFHVHVSSTTTAHSLSLSLSLSLCALNLHFDSAIYESKSQKSKNILLWSNRKEDTQKLQLSFLFFQFWLRNSFSSFFYFLLLLKEPGSSEVSSFQFHNCLCFSFVFGFTCDFATLCNCSRLRLFTFNLILLLLFIWGLRVCGLNFLCGIQVFWVLDLY